MLHTFGDIQTGFPVWIIVLGGFLSAFIITSVVIPSIVKVSGIKGLYDEPNHRTSHKIKVPTLGGAGVFVGLIITISIFSGPGIDNELKYIIAALLILFFIGIKDDILIVDPRKKLVSQILSASIISILGDIRITNFHQLFGIGEISYLYSILLTILVVVFIINGINLIDGIDGLASGIGITAALFFGIWFWHSHYISYSTMSFALAGSLIAFFRFNVFGKDHKIFLGDTGSLIIGLIISVFAIRFLEYDLRIQGSWHIESAPAVVFGVLIIPLFDTMRIILIRLIQGKSPFSPDRQHVHHRLLELRKSHLQATMILIGFNVFFIVLSLLLQSIGTLKLVILQMILAGFFSFIPVFLGRKRKEQALKKL